MGIGSVGRTLWVVTALAGVAFLTGCTGQPENLQKMFEQSQTDEDVLPEGATSNVVESVDAATTRLLWADAGITYYAAKGPEPLPGVCLVLVKENLEAMSGCSTSVPVTMKYMGGPTLMLGDGVSGSTDEWTQVADYLWQKAD